MFRHVIQTAAVSVIVVAGTLVSFGMPTPQASPKTDNTAVNKNAGPTADQQKENKADRTLRQEIRKSVIADKSLSTYAHNIKIISSAIEAKAKGIAGVAGVNNELTVEPEKTK